MQGTTLGINKKLIGSIIATGVMAFTGIVVETAMNLAFPALMKEFNVSTDIVQWLTTGYLLVLAIMIPASSYLRQRFLFKNLFMTSAVLFITGVVLAASAVSFEALLLGRMLQGAATGIALPLTFNIILEYVPEEKLGMMIGIASMITAMAPAVGPFAGGMILNLWGWRVFFWLVLPLLCLTLFAGGRCFGVNSITGNAVYNWREHLLLALGFIILIMALENIGKVFYFAAVLLALAALTLSYFYHYSLKALTPLLNVKVFQYRKFTLAVLMLIILQILVLGLSFLLPNYVQLTLQKNPFDAGLVLVPGCCAGVVLTLCGGKMFDRFGAARPVMLSSALLTLVFAAFSFYSASRNIFTLTLLYTFFAGCQAMINSNMLADSLHELPPELKSSGNAVLNTLQQLAGAIGTVAAASIVALSQQTEGMALGTVNGTYHAYIFFLLLAVCLLYLVFRRFRDLEAAKQERVFKPRTVLFIKGIVIIVFLVESIKLFISVEMFCAMFGI